MNFSEENKLCDPFSNAPSILQLHVNHLDYSSSDSINMDNSSQIDDREKNILNYFCEQDHLDPIDNSQDSFNKELLPSNLLGDLSIHSVVNNEERILDSREDDIVNFFLEPFNFEPADESQADLCQNAKKQPHSLEYISVQDDYESNSPEENSETDSETEEMATSGIDLMYSRRNDDEEAGPSGMRTFKKHSPDEFCPNEFYQKIIFQNKYEEKTADKKSEAGASGIRTHKKKIPLDMHHKNLSSKMADHYDTRTADNLFVCDVCEKQFSRNDNLVRHHRTHTGEKRFECDVCGKKFTRKSHLGLHYRKHTGDKPFVCDACNKAFTGKYNLKVHIRTHTGEKPYKCSVCEMAFTTNSSRKRHQRRKHKHI